MWLGWLHSQYLGLEGGLQPHWEMLGMLGQCSSKQNDSGQTLGSIFLQSQRWLSTILLSYC